MADDDIDYATRAVAFVDILGFKDLIASARGNQVAIKNLHWALHRIKIIEAWASGENTAQKELEVSVFSDNIAISGALYQVPTLIWTVGYLQANLLLGGTLVRGGIAAGLLHHAEGVIYGEGLVAAYEMEQTSAVFPRVLIAPELMQGLNARVRKFLKQDEDDGLWFIDPFRFDATVGGAEELAADGWDPRALYFEEVRKKLHRQLETASSERVAEKIKWSIRRFNEAVAQQEPEPCPPIDLDG